MPWAASAAAAAAPPTTPPPSHTSGQRSGETCPASWTSCGPNQRTTRCSGRWFACTRTRSGHGCPPCSRTGRHNGVFPVAPRSPTPSGTCTTCLMRTRTSSGFTCLRSVCGGSRAVSSPALPRKGVCPCVHAPPQLTNVLVNGSLPNQHALEVFLLDKCERCAGACVWMWVLCIRVCCACGRTGDAQMVAFQT